MCSNKPTWKVLIHSSEKCLLMWCHLSQRPFCLCLVFVAQPCLPFTPDCIVSRKRTHALSAVSAVCASDCCNLSHSAEAEWEMGGWWHWSMGASFWTPPLPQKTFRQECLEMSVFITGLTTGTYSTHQTNYTVWPQRGKKKNRKIEVECQSRNSWLINQYCTCRHRLSSDLKTDSVK